MLIIEATYPQVGKCMPSLNHSPLSTVVPNPLQRNGFCFANIGNIISCWTSSNLTFKNKTTAMFGLETKHDLTYQPAIICKSVQGGAPPLFDRQLSPHYTMLDVYQ